jgi:uncharacterized protein YjbI with pentapeptide repeats
MSMSKTGSQLPQDNQSQPPPEGLVDLLRALVQELILEKKRTRERASRETGGGSRRSRFWHWWADNAAVVTPLVTTVITVVSLLGTAYWTVTQYTAQERQRLAQQDKEASAEQLTLVASYAGQLGDKDKRIAATHALAFLAPEKSFPILFEHFRAATGPDDLAFRNALVRSFTTMGERTLPLVLALHREAASPWQSGTSRRTPEEHEIVREATQDVLLHFFRSDPAKFLATTDLSGVVLKRLDLAFATLSGLDLSHVTVSTGSFCGAKLEGARLTGVRAEDIQFGGAKMDGATLTKARFSGSRLSGTSLVKAVGDEVGFVEADLTTADLSSSRFTNTDFNRATLYRARLKDANLRASHFTSADLERADFSGADLAGAWFFRSSMGDSPSPTGSGAFVAGANFEGARGIEDDTRAYLCKWGAINVPGGCRDEKPAKLIPIARSGSGGSCF